MGYQPRNFEHLKRQLGGALSAAQLDDHFALYASYVQALDEIEERLRGADRTRAGYAFSDYGELRRREPVAYNGAVLHELYFEGLGAAGQAAPEWARATIERGFGSWESYARDCAAIVGACHGWSLTVYDHNYDRVRNVMVQSEHHVGLGPNHHVLLALDAWEHAYFRDYGRDKTGYLDALWRHVAWEVVARRLAAATGRE